MQMQQRVSGRAQEFVERSRRGWFTISACDQKVCLIVIDLQLVPASVLALCSCVGDRLQLSQQVTPGVCIYYTFQGFFDALDLCSTKRFRHACIASITWCRGLSRWSSPGEEHFRRGGICPARQQQLRRGLGVLRLSRETHFILRGASARVNHLRSFRCVDSNHFQLFHIFRGLKDLIKQFDPGRHRGTVRTHGKTFLSLVLQLGGGKLAKIFRFDVIVVNHSTYTALSWMFVVFGRRLHRAALLLLHHAANVTLREVAVIHEHLGMRGRATLTCEQRRRSKGLHHVNGAVQHALRGQSRTPLTVRVQRPTDSAKMRLSGVLVVLSIVVFFRSGLRIRLEIIFG
mmetsp:Transcript_44892/g.78363  ORF Transcript_44892/g.78363 Transcript_44892/m.78363 type:complete len:344 (+) Transcript_44892:521-1552(+)